MLCGSFVGGWMVPVRRLLGFSVLVSVPLVVAGCGEEPGSETTPAPSPAWVSDSAGVEIVANFAEGVWGPGERGVEEVLRIGVVEGDELVQLFQVADVAFGPDGFLLVANRGTATIRVFDGDGRFVRELGGRGQGPGEFLDVSRLFPAHDRIWVMDMRQLRVTALSYEGEPLETWTFIHDGVISLLHLTAEGWLGLAYRSDRPRPARAPPGTPHPTRIFLDRVGPPAEPDTGGSPEPVVELPTRTVYAEPSGTSWAAPFFSPAPRTGVDEKGRIYVAAEMPYQVDVHSPEGDLVRRVRRETALRPIGPGFADELLAHATEYFRGPGFTGSRDDAQRQLARIRRDVEWQASLPMPSHLPPTGRLVVSPDGSFWIERIDEFEPARIQYERMFPNAQREAASHRETPWDLFDAAGHLLGTVRLPAGFDPHRADGLQVLGVERDELGVEYVVLYRAVPEPA